MKEIVNMTPDFVACIGDVREGAAADYRKEKLPGRADETAAAEAGDAPPIVIATPDQQPRLHNKQREAIDGFIQCATGMLDKKYPLLSGEVVQADVGSYLLAPFMNFPAGTAVIKRTTNMADLYFVIPDVTVEENGDLVRRTSEPRPMLKGGIDTSALATKFAKGLVSSAASAIGGAIAHAIMDEIFPPGVPSYFDEVYENMARLIGEGLSQDKIDSVNGSINAVKQHLSDEYGPARKDANLEDGKKRKSLYALLQKYDSAFISGPGGMLETLQISKYQVPGFSVFLLGASLQLVLFQEMANVVAQTDSSGKFLRADETSYGKPKSGTVALTAAKYASYAEQTWPKVLDARTKNIRVVTYEANKHVIPGGGGDIYWELWGAIEDDGQKKLARQIAKNNEKDGSNPSRAALDGELEPYKTRVRNDLTNSYTDPYSIIGLWRQLIDKPIRVS